MTEQELARKISLPEYCSAPSGWNIFEGHLDCEHDYPPESKVEKADYVYWDCSRCGNRRAYEVID